MRGTMSDQLAIGVLGNVMLRVGVSGAGPSVCSGK